MRGQCWPFPVAVWLLALIPIDTASRANKGACDEWKRSGRVVLQLAVFVDHPLYQDFHHRYNNDSTVARKMMQEFILSMVQQGQQLFLAPTLQPKVHIDVVEYKIISRSFPPHAHRRPRQDMPTYMDSFCRYQRKLNTPRKWDHAVLFTGFDLFHLNKKGNFAGYSSSRSVCGPLSCSLVEANSFKSAYTFAHELGHSLGMLHDDGSENCSSSCCVMAPVIFSGSQEWSPCSVSQFQDYLQSIPCEIYCLNKPSIKSTRPNLPGQLYTAADQCHHHFGACSKPYIVDHNHRKTICNDLWCTQADGGVRLAHAALEGTYCAPEKWCRFGECVNADEDLEPRDGQWSSWFVPPSDGVCGNSACSKREIIGQLSVQRRVRTCSEPSPNNGGVECDGDDERGLVCHDEIDKDNENSASTDSKEQENALLQTADEFATKICTGHRRKAEKENSTFVVLSGEGFQRMSREWEESNACFVWCHVVNASFTSYTFFDPFPDGTPCASNRFCLAGKCTERVKCNSTVTLLTNQITSDCQPQTESKASTKSEIIPKFSPWSAWNDCSKTCGIGVKRRVRKCKPSYSHACSKLSTTQQFQFCRANVPQCPSQPPTTTETGNEVTPLQRKEETPEKKSDVNEDEYEKNKVELNVARGKYPDPTVYARRDHWMNKMRVNKDRNGRWTAWSSWSECSSDCNGFQKSTRTCLSPVRCRGPQTKRRRCNMDSDCDEY